MAKYRVTYSAQSGLDGIITGRIFYSTECQLVTEMAIARAEQFALADLRETKPQASKLFFTWFQKLEG
jgi:hypothetical protein